MIMAYLALVSGLFISAVAIYYSIVGLASVFAAAVIPIMIMGTALEVAKLVAASWLKQNWKVAPIALKTYLVVAVAVLMLITSMGIFGYLSKAHLDQNITSGDVQSKIAIYDEKIKTAKDNIDANRKALKQMDEAVDQVMGRSSDEKGAEKAVAIRRGQQKERARLQSEITSEQKIVAALNEERAPIAAEVRKVEAEVGPIKYIAALLYGDNPDQNILDKAVTWVIILIVIVFDPLAISLLMAAQFSLEQRKPKPRLTDEDGQLTSDFFKAMTPQDTTFDRQVKIPEPVVPIVHPENIDNEDADNDVIIVKEPVVEYAYLNTEKSFWEKPEGWVDVPPQVYKPEEPVKVEEPVVVESAEAQKEIVIMNSEYISIDGQTVYYNSMGGGDSTVKNATDLANKLLATGKYYMITHTPDSIIISDEKGTTTTVQVDTEGPTYVQNEEQQVSGLWKTINNITEEEYIEKSKKAQEKKD
jgi:hypothetical protein